MYERLGRPDLADRMMDAREHWEKVYGTKKPTEVSWYQREAALSLSLIRRTAADRQAPIIDVGGGASSGTIGPCSTS
jgi:hypothetical protein